MTDTWHFPDAASPHEGTQPCGHCSPSAQLHAQAHRVTALRRVQILPPIGPARNQQVPRDLCFSLPHSTFLFADGSKPTLR